MDSKVIVKNYKIALEGRVDNFDEAIRPQDEILQTFINSEREEINEFGGDW
jgi:hypothetical protein